MHNYAFLDRLEFVKQNLTFTIGSTNDKYHNCVNENMIKIADLISVIHKKFTDKRNNGEALELPFLNDKGQIRIGMNTGNDYKLKSLHYFFKDNLPMGRILSDIFDIEQFSEKDTDEGKLSMLENAILKSKVEEIKDIFVIGDDSGLVLNYPTLLISDVSPGVISKRWLSDDSCRDELRSMALEVEGVKELRKVLFDRGYDESTVKNITVLKLMKDLETSVNEEIVDADPSTVYDIHGASIACAMAVSINGKLIGSSLKSLDGKVDYPSQSELQNYPGFNQYEITKNLNSEDEWRFWEEIKVAELIKDMHGYNGIFHPEGFGKTLGRLTWFEIVNYDHRAKAITEVLIEILKYIAFDE